MFLCNAASGLYKPVAVSQFLHNLEQLDAMPFGSLREGFAPQRLIQIMQKLAGHIPRPASLSGVLCGLYAR